MQYRLIGLLIGSVLIVGCAAPVVTTKPDVAAVRVQNEQTQRHITKTQHDITTVQSRLDAIKKHADAADNDLEVVGKDLDALLYKK